MDASRARLREHFLAPRLQGRPLGCTGVGRAENRVCGDRLELFLAAGEGARVAALGYRFEGCSALGATASLVSEVVEDMLIEDAAALDVVRLVTAAGGLPPAKGHAPRVVQRALRQALADHRSRYPS